MSGCGRLYLQHDLRWAWDALTWALRRGSTHRGDARVVDAEGNVIAELLAGQRFMARLPAGLGAPLTESDMAACNCPRQGAGRGCLQAHHAPGGAVVLSGRCARVLARALAAVVVSRPQAAFLELADFGVLPSSYQNRWVPPPTNTQGAGVSTMSAADLAELYRAFVASRPHQVAPRRSGSGRPGVLLGYGQCIDCGRLLSDMVSIERGRGPICEGRHHRRRRPTAARRR